MASLIDLDEIVETWAWDAFKKGYPKHDYKLSDVNLNINWENVRFSTSDVQFSNDQKGKPTSHIIFKSTFKNDTGIDQQHSLKSERTSTSTQSTTMTKGLKRSVNFSIKLASPQNIASATAGYGREITVQDGTSYTRSDTITWTTDGSINVPKKSTVIAEVHIEEEELSCNFQAKVQIKGRVNVGIFSIKEGKHLGAVEGNMTEIMKTNNQVHDDIVNISGKTLFRYGVEQHVKTRAG